MGEFLARNRQFHIKVSYCVVRIEFALQIQIPFFQIYIAQNTLKQKNTLNTRLRG